MASQIIAVVDDLFFKSKIKAAANALGVRLLFVKDIDELDRQIKDKKPRLIIFDLNIKTLDSIDTIRTINTQDISKPTTLGYYSHVDQALRKKAQDAGFNIVIPKSKFSMELSEILSEYIA